MRADGGHSLRRILVSSMLSVLVTLYLACAGLATALEAVATAGQ